MSKSFTCYNNGGSLIPAVLFATVHFLWLRTGFLSGPRMSKVHTRRYLLLFRHH